MIVNSRQGLSRNKISNFSLLRHLHQREINSWKHFSGSAILLVPTVFTNFLALPGRETPRAGIFWANYNERLKGLSKNWSDNLSAFWWTLSCEFLRNSYSGEWHPQIEWNCFLRRLCEFLICELCVEPIHTAQDEWNVRETRPFTQSRDNFRSEKFWMHRRSHSSRPKMANSRAGSRRWGWVFYPRK